MDNTRSRGTALPDVRRGIPVRPFGRYAVTYHELGWPGIFPVARRGTKAPLVKGVTGHEGKDLTIDELIAMARRYSRVNIGLRLPLDVIGLDVDAYDGRNGGRTLRRLEARLGPLPETWRSTSRAPEDPVSGIYLFRAPRRPDWLWVADLGLGSGIEIIQRHHRFVTAPPSRHNTTGREYQWWRGMELADAPRPGDLPLLPVEWARYLRSPRAYRPSRSAPGGEAAQWLERVGKTRAACPLMRNAAVSAAAEIQNANRHGGLHDAITRVTWNLAHYAAEGHRGLGPALDRVGRAVAGSSRARGLRSEWDSAVASAAAHAAGQEQASTDPCTELRGIGGRHG